MKLRPGLPCLLPLEPQHLSSGCAQRCSSSATQGSTGHRQLLLDDYFLFCVSYIIQFLTFSQDQQLQQPPRLPSLKTGETATAAAKGEALMFAETKKLHNFSIFLKLMADAKAHCWRTKPFSSSCLKRNANYLQKDGKCDKVSSIIRLKYTHLKNPLCCINILLHRVQKYFHFFGWFQSLERMRSHGRGGEPGRGKRNG